jgi:drug/metabolite transporter (DMT)-like permease
MSSHVARALPGAAPAEDRLRAILLVCAASVCFSLSDATAKFVSQTLPAIEVAWVRYSVFLAIALAVASRTPRAWRTGRPVLHAVRGAAIVVSAILYIFGLQHLPMADAAAINFVSPVMITLLALPVLGERVDGARWLAVVAGLGGALVAAHPGGGTLQAAAALPFLSAVTWAAGMVLTRVMAGTERPTTILLWTAATGFVLLSCALPFDVRLPTRQEFLLCLLIGVIASSAQWLVILGYRLAPASLLSPFSYLQLIWSAALGFLIFAAVPGFDTVAGAGVIVASGLYLAQRERARR